MPVAPFPHSLWHRKCIQTLPWITTGAKCAHLRETHIAWDCQAPGVVTNNGKYHEDDCFHLPVSFAYVLLQHSTFTQNPIFMKSLNLGNHRGFSIFHSNFFLYPYRSFILCKQSMQLFPGSTSSLPMVNYLLWDALSCIPEGNLWVSHVIHFLTTTLV